MKQFISDFQAFISRGNVVDMAVGVIVGAAFTAIVNSLVKDVINPILGVLIGSQDFSNFFFVLSMPENYTGPMSYDALTKAGAAVFGPEFFQQVLVLEVRVGNPRQERLGLHLINVDVIGAAVGKVHGHLLDIGVAFRVDGPERDDKIESEQLREPFHLHFLFRPFGQLVHYICFQQSVYHIHVLVLLMLNPRDPNPRR